MTAGAKLRHARGYILLARSWTTFEYGCAPCVSSKAWTAFFLNLTLAWWCIPWGLFAPVLILQTLGKALRQRPHDLDQILAKAGLRREDLEMDEYGLVSADRAVLDLVCFHLRALIGEYGQAYGVSAVAELADTFEGVFTAPLIEMRMQQLGSVSPRVADVPQGVRDGIWALLAKTLLGVDAPEAETLTRVELLAEQLDVSARLREGFKRAAGDDSGAGRYTAVEVDRARGVLGVEPDAPIAVIRKRYHALMLQYHPDRAILNGLSSEEAVARSQEITAAYNLLTTLVTV